MKKELNYYVTRVSILTRNSSVSILKLGLLHYECKRDLSSNDYELFLHQTGYKKNTSTVRKYERIGESYLRLKPIVKLLPPCWTTIYHISTLTNHELNLLEKNNVLSKSITKLEINEFLSKKLNTNLQKFVYKLKLNPTITPEELSSFHESISSYVTPNIGQLVLNDYTEQLINLGSSQSSIFKQG
jgi:hypothetical protein